MGIRDGRDLLAGKDPHTLTEWQWLALSSSYNLSDAHARDTLSGDERSVLARSAELFDKASETRQSDLEVALATALFQAAAEPVELLDSEVNFLVHYSASVSIELALKAVLADRAGTIGIIEPCFDSIPQLARRMGFNVVPIYEPDFGMPELLTTNLDSVLIVVPNNPTGWTPTQDEFLRLSDVCATRDMTLLVDCSFRFFEPTLDQWSIYEVLESFPTLDYCVIEDTGKTWPLKDLKLGMTVAQGGGRLSSRLREVTDELLLNVSPFLVIVLRDIIGLSRSRLETTPLLRRRQLVASNRAALGELLDQHGLVGQIDSQIGADWVALRPEQDSTKLAAMLAAHGVSVLPGGPFTWSDPGIGASRLRVALTRDPDYFRQALYKLRTILDLAQP